jgi:hypothetical protein
MGHSASTVLPLKAWLAVSRGPLVAACGAHTCWRLWYGLCTIHGIRGHGCMLSSIRPGGALEGGKSDRQLIQVFFFCENRQQCQLLTR